MDIKEFLELSIGDWFSLRTIYDLNQQKSDNSKSEVSIENLDCDNPLLAQLLQRKKISSSAILGAIKINWNNNVDWGKTKQIGSSIMVLIPDSDNYNQGQLLTNINNQLDQITVGKYIFGQDEALTLFVEKDHKYLQERLWFASPNLKLRNTLIKDHDGITTTSFYSEIRKMPPKSD